MGYVFAFLAIFVLCVLGIIFPNSFGPGLFVLVAGGVIGYFVLEYLSVDRPKLAQEKAAAEEREYVKTLTKEERKVYFEKKAADRKLEQRMQELRSQEFALQEKERQLKKRERQLEQEAKSAKEQAKPKVPFAAKLATSAVVGYKAGKHIAKW